MLVCGCCFRSRGSWRRSPEEPDIRRRCCRRLDYAVVARWRCVDFCERPGRQLGHARRRVRRHLCGYARCSVKSPVFRRRLQVPRVRPSRARAYRRLRVSDERDGEVVPAPGSCGQPLSSLNTSCAIRRRFGMGKAMWDPGRRSRSIVVKRRIRRRRRHCCRSRGVTRCGRHEGVNLRLRLVRKVGFLSHGGEGEVFWVSPEPEVVEYSRMRWIPILKLTLLRVVKVGPLF